MNDEQINNLNKEIKDCVKEIEEIINNTIISDINELTDIVNKVYSIYNRFPNSEEIAERYMFTLEVLEIKQMSDISLQMLLETQVFPEELWSTVAKIYNVYKKFPNSEEIAERYISTLVLLARKKDYISSQKILESMSKNEELSETQEFIVEFQDIVAKVYDIYKKFPNSEEIAYRYVITLSLLYESQNSLEEFQDTFMRIIDIHHRFPNNESINFLIESIISDYIKYYVIDSPKGQEANSWVNLEILLDCITDFAVEQIVDIMDEMFCSLNHLRNLTDGIAQKIVKLIFRFSRAVSLQQTKYAVLIDLLSDLENTDYQLELIIKIYYMVQTIKYQLSVKDLSNINFGHYTSGEVLQNILKQECKLSEDSYSIKGRTRLGNVKYMNDPEEGRILDKYLKPREINDLEVSLKPSPWFLMSLTTAIDDLAMWSQYGYRAEGVCLLFEEDSFAAAYSVVDTDWFTRKNDIPVFERNLKLTDEKINSSYKKDFLYRICYLDEESLKEGESHVVKKNNNNMLENSEIEQINSCLEQIKSILSKIEKKTLLYSAVEECLEEIRYLFKASGYSYEAELRILKYADLSPDNNKIKIDNSGPVAKLYLERDMPIQLKQVIFGPKFSNPEHVTPLIYLLDKNIEFKRSERKFK